MGVVKTISAISFICFVMCFFPFLLILLTKKKCLREEFQHPLVFVKFYTGF